jgi:(S)-sulfolactate dehydrogenase
MKSNAMPDIVITEFVDEAAVADLSTDYSVVYDPGLADRRAEIAELLADAIALIVRNRTRVDAALLDAGPNLKVVGRLGVGLDNIDLDACEARGIPVCPATGANSVSVAEYVIATLLTLLRGETYRSNGPVIAGQWPRTVLVGRDAAGKSLGLVGLGAIAREVATRAAALGMSVLAHDPYLPSGDPAWQLAEARALPELLAGADVVTLHVPLSGETRHLIGAAALAAMKPDAILINASRGGVVDEDAVVAALRAGDLGGAALDVFETEPLTAAAAARFAGVPNLILTPHVAGVTVEANRRTGRITVANVRAVLEGRP